LQRVSVTTDSSRTLSPSDFEPKPEVDTDLQEQSRRRTLLLTLATTITIQKASQSLATKYSMTREPAVRASEAPGTVDVLNAMTTILGVDHEVIAGMACGNSPGSSVVPENLPMEQ
jgi:hypothetical protein